MSQSMSSHSLGVRNDDAALLEQVPTEQEETASLIQTSKAEIHPKTINSIIRRVRLLVIKLVSDEIEEESLTGKEGILSNNVVDAFGRIAGDFHLVVPFALLESKKLFERDAEVHESGLNNLRALACEVLARKVVARSERRSFQGLDSDTTGPTSTYLSLTKKFQRIDDDGDFTTPLSALESAVDQHSTIFLSSTEVQNCVAAMWKGKLVRRYDEQTGNAYYIGSDIASDGSFWKHFDASRLQVPRNSYYLSIASFMFFLVLYSISTRTYKGLDIWEILLWIWAVGFVVEDIGHMWKIRGLDAVQLWIVMDMMTDVLLVTSFVFRLLSFIAKNHNDVEYYQLRAFQWLACLAPLLWLQVLKAADLIPYFGTIFIIMMKMLKETSIFVILLLLNAIGFFLSLYALDAADGNRVEDATTLIIDALVQAFLGGANFDSVGDAFGKPFGKILYYIYCFIVMLILANILVAFFSSAYEAVTENADDMFRSYFAEKTIGLSRAPDEFLYISPFNLLETCLIAPLEFVIPRKTYVRMNRVIQYTIFCVPLFIIALLESREVRNSSLWNLKNFEGLPEDFDREQARNEQDGDEGGRDMDMALEIENPKVPKEEKNQGEISKWSWKELVAKLPDLDKGGSEHRHQDGKPALTEQEQEQEQESSEGKQTSSDQALSMILQELKSLRKEVEELKKPEKSPY